MNNDKLFCFDAFGVLHDGVNLFPNVKQALLKYKKHGKVVILTNTTMPYFAVEEQLKAKGLTNEFYDKIISSGDILIAEIKSEFIKRNKKINFFSKEKNTLLMQELERYVIFTNIIEEADFIYLSADRNEINIDKITSFKNDILNFKLEHFSKYLVFSKEEISKMKNKKLLCANPDIIAMSGDKIILVQGFQAKYLLENYDLDITFFGKPYHFLFQQAMNLFQINPENTYMFGDQICTDIVGALSLNMNAILVNSNITEITKNITYPGLNKFLDKIDNITTIDNINDFSLFY